MTTIIYKKILGRYEIIEINVSSRENLRIEFEEPIDANLIVSDIPYSVVRGVCNIPINKIPDGRVVPRLYTGAGVEMLEGFIISDGIVAREPVSDDYARRLSLTVDVLLLRIRNMETRIAELENKIERKIVF